MKLKSLFALLAFGLFFVLIGAQLDALRIDRLELLVGKQHQFPILISTENTEQPQDLLSLNKEGVLHLGPKLNRDEKPADGYLLYVQEGIRTERVKVDIATKSGWADYVFADDYQLMSLHDLEVYIAKNGHLPGVPSSELVLDEGIDLADTDRMLLEKIEELSLHIIALNKKINELENR